MNEEQVVHEQDGDSGSPTVMALDSFKRKCSLQAAEVDETRQNEAELVMRGLPAGERPHLAIGIGPTSSLPSS